MKGPGTVNKKPIVFLDIDGVLNSGMFHEQHIKNNHGLSWRENNRDYVLEEKSKPLFDLLETYSVQVVIISSWVRSNLSKDSDQIKELQTFFNYSDIIGSLTTTGSEDRALDIVKFMEQYSNPWIVLDDAYELYYINDFPKKHLIVCDGRYGMGKWELYRLKNMLENST